MKINRIAYEFTKNLGEYQNCKLRMEADLEDWEDTSQAVDYLRNQVAQELDLADRWRDLRHKAISARAELQVVLNSIKFSEENLKKAQQEWEKYTAFLVAHGVHPESLEINGLHAGPWAIALKLQEFCTKCVETDNFAGFIQEVQHILKGNEAPGFVGNEYDGCFDDDSHPDPDYIDPYHGPEDDDDDDDFIDPYYGDEYDSIHNRTVDEEDEPENSYF